MIVCSRAQRRWWCLPMPLVVDAEASDLLLVPDADCGAPARVTPPVVRLLVGWVGRVRRAGCWRAVSG